MSQSTVIRLIVGSQYLIILFDNSHSWLKRVEVTYFYFPVGFLNENFFAPRFSVVESSSNSGVW